MNARSRPDTHSRPSVIPFLPSGSGPVQHISRRRDAARFGNAPPKGSYRVQVYLGDTRVFDLIGDCVLDTNQPGYRIVGKVIAHAPYHGIIRESGYPSDELPE